MRRRTWFIIIIIVLTVGLSYAGFSLLTHDKSDPLAVSELKLQVEPFERQLRIEGKITPGSINWDNETQVITFVLADDKESLTVVYEGRVPDNFKPGTDLTVEGTYRPDGVFEASSVGDDDSYCSFCH